jgi:hypothetical protein
MIENKIIELIKKENLCVRDIRAALNHVREELLNQSGYYDKAEELNEIPIKALYEEKEKDR